MAYPDFSYRGRPLAVPPMITSPYKPPSVTHPVEGHARVTDASAASIAKSVYMPLDLYLTGKLG
ncbi:MAG: hypothetical protein KGL95_11390, partial [Patescibacteria group bacterium]|nr:hypothetical protein [Patescibacteria group bacterium]